MNKPDMAREVLANLIPASGKYAFKFPSPHVLYLSDAQADSYLAAMANPNYEGFHSKTSRLIERHANEIVKGTQQIFLVDLGPGFPDKAIPLGKECKTQNIALNYCAVDISPSFLKIATREMQPYTQSSVGVCSLFDSAARDLPDSPGDRIVMLGLTFMNFEPGEIATTLFKYLKNRTRFLIAAQVLESQNSIAGLIAQYQTAEAKAVAFGPFAAVDVEENSVVYSVEFANQRIEMSFGFSDPIPPSLAQAGVKKGDRILTAISHRWTERELKNVIEKYFPECEAQFWRDGDTVLAMLKA